ncbi:MAG: DNA primase [Syntrophomonadaceae bacterium]|nr:DNA primase [Syntrophomonadaceae bacterium]
MTRFYDDQVLREIESRIGILDVVGETVHLTRKGNRYWGICPFHEEKTGSFCVTPEKNMFYCFGCHAGGDLFTFVMKRDNLDFKEAVSLLATRSGVEIKPLSPESRYQKDKQKQVIEVNQIASKYFMQALTSPHGEKALDYLLKRGITIETIRNFQIGYAPPAWNSLEEFLLSKACPQQAVKFSGLIKRSEQYDRYYDLFRDRIIFPIHNVQGDIVGFGGRVLDNSLPKYLNTPETEIFSKRKNLFGLYQAKDFIRQQNQLLLVEGYMDCIKLYQAGIHNSVASLGTALTVEQARLMKRYTEEVILLFDGDEAGQREALRAIQIMCAEGLKVWVVSLPGGKDPDEYLDLYGKEEFLRYIQNSKSDHIEFKINRYIDMEKELNLETSSRIIQAIKADIVQLPGEIEKDHYTRLLARRLNVGEYIIRQELKKERNTYKEGINKHKSEIIRDNIGYGNYSLEEKILVSMLKNQENFEQIRKNIGLEFFQNQDFKELINNYAGYLDAGEGGEQALNRMVQTRETGQTLTRVLFLLDDEDAVLNSIEIQNFIRRVEMKRAEHRYNKVMEQLDWLGEQGDFYSLLKFILDIETCLNHTRKGVIQ